VFVATGENFPDSLAGGPLAARYGAPILLVGRDWVPASVIAEIQRLEPEDIVILGGPGAVSDKVRNDLARTGRPVYRMWGADRYETAAVISETWEPWVAEVYLATGENYPDALAGGAAAVAADAPILLVQRNAIPAATVNALRALNPDKIILLGGTGVISPTVEANVAKYATTGKVERWAGPDRYATAATICARAFGGGAVSVFVATGEDFPDALAGVAAAAVWEGPILLVQKGDVPSATAAELRRLASG
jgi:putative cell wall-binding protein